MRRKRNRYMRSSCLPHEWLTIVKVLATIIRPYSQ
nr:MAG TPA: hypothetical protein [Caudoviricetes sp.]DAO90552.1 MAG TPA: hypothetical protein [Caudoviricetes sp.]DAR38625.1 MAG TPA: hypothetical protein [Caudoviricetes sp.]